MAVAPNGDAFAVAGDALSSSLYRSSDGGETWSVVLLPERGIQSMAVSPEGTIFAVSWQETLFRSEDDGQTWQSIDYPGAFARALAFDPEGHLFIGGDAVYRSEDSGRTWESLGLENVQIRAFAFTDTSDIVVATSEGLFRSTGSAPWTKLASSVQPNAVLPHPDGSLLLGVAGLAALGEESGLFRLQSNGQVVLAGLEGLAVTSLVADGEGRLFAGINGRCTGEVCFPPAGVYRSIDGGHTWASAGLISTPVPVLAVDAQDQLFAGTQGLFTDTGNLLSRGLMRSQDHGATWSGANQGLPHAQTYALRPGPEGFLYAAADHSVFRSSDHGATWVKIYTDEPTAEAPDPPFYRLAVGAEGALFLLVGHPPITTGGVSILYMQARLLHSSDQGETWTEVTDVGIAGPLVMSAAGTLLMATPNSILRSDDHGMTWSSASTGLPDEPVIALDPVDAGPVFAATFNPQSWNVTLLRSTNDGVTWNVVGSLENILFPESLALVARDAETLYAGSHVLRFTQPAEPWDVSDLGLTVQDLVFDTEATLYAIGGDEPFRSTDDGFTWEPLASGLPERHDMLDLAIGSDGYLYVGGDQGVFRSMVPVRTSVTPEGEVPKGFMLEPNYPNPFRHTTQFSLTLAHPARVTLKIYDLLGREQAVLLQEAYLQAGRHEVAWTPEGLPSGAYIYKCTTGHTAHTGSLILLR